MSEVQRSGTDTPGMKAVERAIQVLQTLTVHPAGLSLSELARETGIPISTLHRLLAVLRNSSLVAETSAGAHVVGVGAVVLSRAFLDRVDVREVAHPVMAELVAATGETCHLGVLASVHIVYLDKIDSPHAVRMVSRVGGTNPAPTTAIGRAILAHSSPEDVEVVLDGYRRLFGMTVDAAAFDRVLDQVRTDGWSCDLQENEPGICCVGSAVFDFTGRPVAGISVSAPASRFDEFMLFERGAALRDAAERISAGLGWRRPAQGELTEHGQ